MKNSKFFLIAFAVLILYFLPGIIQGENAFICIHDFLDSTMAHIKSMKDTGTLFDYDATMPIMCGLPRFIYEASTNLKIWIYAIMPLYWGVLLNLFIVKATAFTGLFLLLKTYVIPGEDRASRTACFAASLLFMMVPFYVDYGVSSAGIPLITYAFINLFKSKKTIPSLLLLIYYALNSTIVLGGAFACAAAALFIFAYTIREKRFPVLPFAGLCLLAFTCLAANWQMIEGFLTYPEPFSRSEYALQQSPFVSLLDCLAVFLVSQYHAGTFLAILPVVAFILVWKKYRGSDRMLDYLMQALVSLAGVIVFFAVVKIVFNRVMFIREFQSDRFFFLYPGLCFILLGATFGKLLENGDVKKVKWIAALMLVVNLSCDINVTQNIGRWFGADTPGFREFYDTALFKEIKEDNGIRDFKDKVACVGMYQSVAEYNDIYTVDGYIQMYPLHYKREFQKVIQGELDKSEDLKRYFCDWGSRCYIFSSELGRNYMFSRKADRAIECLDIDCKALSGLGCKYILSAVRIGNYQELGLEYVRSYTNDDSYWNISVYKVPGYDTVEF